MSWTLDIAFVSSILVEPDNSWTWYQFHSKFYLILFPCICRTSKSDFVWVLYINLNLRWPWTLSWTWSQTLEFWIGLDLNLDVRISLPPQHPLYVLFILIISVIPNVASLWIILNPDFSLRQISRMFRRTNTNTRWNQPIATKWIMGSHMGFVSASVISAK
jgi:hypothetical protein